MQIFKQDNPFNAFMSRIGDLAMVNVAWAVCCIPIVTIGASTAAMYEVVRAMHEGRDAHVLKQFGRAFTRRFGVSLALEAIAAAFAALATFDLWYLTKQETNVSMASLAYGVIIAIAIVVAAGAGFVFPLTSRSKLTVGAQIRQSFAVALRYPVVALEILVLNALPFAIAVFVPGGLFPAVFFWALLFTAASAWLVIHLMLQSGIIALPAKPAEAAEAAEPDNAE
ncbi:MAG: YesL family protein [Bifidobacterium scardovii]|uniref:YesL family protein n=1 Tax=Bifidobacterium scardovii TaxID=158787 RepID=UPI000665C3CD|nr:YesL family protein [Bifidobacterium scardovii]MBS6947668.1 YesL family protein [Bifidobacterium scardovii]MDU3737271.1 YesL family protein [Bifidobacterium scardovii]MDU5297004.1 YesL family protein [Bifidobacterium scardovii]MDU5611478.1 YesL family protein [Bifidobacterium scardovii]MDU5887182.1 YesL family protein [Bifidobacterium scardovii]